MGSRVQLVQVFNWGKGFIDARLPFHFFQFKISIGSIDSRVQLVPGLNWVRGKLVQLAQLS